MAHPPDRHIPFILSILKSGTAARKSVVPD